MVKRTVTLSPEVYELMMWEVMWRKALKIAAANRCPQIGEILEELVANRL